MIDIDRVCGRIKQLVEYLQAGKQSSSFTAPFTLEKNRTSGENHINHCQVQWFSCES